MAESYYDSPININAMTDHIKMMMADEFDSQVIKVVQNVGIEIDRESLIEALHSDRKRYEAAYQKGYADAEEHYKGILEKIKELAN